MTVEEGGVPRLSNALSRVMSASDNNKGRKCNIGGEEDVDQTTLKRKSEASISHEMLQRSLSSLDVSSLASVDADIVTHYCRWDICTSRFDRLDDLVKDGLCMIYFQHLSTTHTGMYSDELVCMWKECPRGSRSFTKHYLLVVHLRKHTGEKPYHCSFEQCNKAYSRKDNLKTHERSHTDQRPYVCGETECTKTFMSASDRWKHQTRTHSDTKQFRCPYEHCTKAYKDPSSLRKHVKCIHPDESNNRTVVEVDARDGGRNMLALGGHVGDESVIRNRQDVTPFTSRPVKHEHHGTSVAESYYDTIPSCLMTKLVSPTVPSPPPPDPHQSLQRSALPSCKYSSHYNPPAVCNHLVFGHPCMSSPAVRGDSLDNMNALRHSLNEVSEMPSLGDAVVDNLLQAAGADKQQSSVSTYATNINRLLQKGGEQDTYHRSCMRN